MVTVIKTQFSNLPLKEWGINMAKQKHW